MKEFLLALLNPIKSNLYLYFIVIVLLIVGGIYLADEFLHSEGALEVVEEILDEKPDLKKQMTDTHTPYAQWARTTDFLTYFRDDPPTFYFDVDGEHMGSPGGESVIVEEHPGWKVYAISFTDSITREIHTEMNLVFDDHDTWEIFKDEALEVATLFADELKEDY